MEYESLVLRLANLEQLVSRLVQWTNYREDIPPDLVRASSGHIPDEILDKQIHHDNNTDGGGETRFNIQIECTPIIKSELDYACVEVEHNAEGTVEEEQTESEDDGGLLSEYWMNNNQNLTSCSSSIQKSSANLTKPCPKRALTSRSSKGVPSKKKKAYSNNRSASSSKQKLNQLGEEISPGNKNAVHQCCYCGEVVYGGAFIFHSHIRLKHRQYVDNVTCIGCQSKLSSLYALRRHHKTCEPMVDILSGWNGTAG